MGWTGTDGNRKTTQKYIKTFALWKRKVFIKYFAWDCAYQRVLNGLQLTCNASKCCFFNKKSLLRISIGFLLTLINLIHQLHIYCDKSKTSIKYFDWGQRFCGNRVARFPISIQPSKLIWPLKTFATTTLSGLTNW